MSNKLTDIYAARPVLKSQVTDNDLFYIVDPEAATDAEKSKGIRAEELLKFTGGDVTNTGVDGTLTIGNDKVTRDMVQNEVLALKRVDISADTTLTAALHANSLLWVDVSGGNVTLTINNNVFGDGDAIYVSQAGNSTTNKVIINGTETFKVPKDRAGVVRDIETTGDRRGLMLRFSTGGGGTKCLVTFDESHEEYTFSSSEWSNGAKTFMAADDRALVEYANSNERKMTGRTIHNVETVTNSTSSITINSDKINQNLICTNAGSIAVTINHGNFKVGDWCTLLHTGAGTLTIQAAGSTVKIHSPGVTTSASHTITDQYGFVTILCFEDGTNDKFVLLGPVAEV
jgi:hypothetical protein